MNRSINRRVWFGLGACGALLIAGANSPALAGDQDGKERSAPSEEGMSQQMQVWAKAAQPGEHHKILDRFAGRWNAEIKFWMEKGAEPMETGGSVTREWIFGGRYLREKVEAETPMGKFQGLGFMGYNNVEGRYEAIWMENHATKIHFETGQYDPETKTFHFRGSHLNPATGKVMHTQTKVDVSDPDRHMYIGHQIGPDDGRFKNFEGVFTRIE